VKLRGGSTKQVPFYRQSSGTWHSRPPFLSLAKRYAQEVGPCAWLRADGKVFAFWYINGKVLSRRGVTA